MTVLASGEKALIHKGIAAICCVVFLVVLLYMGVFGAFDVRAKDALISKKAPLDAITVLAIDDKSIHDVGRWPWSRAEVAKLIDAVPPSSVIGVDIAYFEPGASAAEDAALEAAFAKKRAVLVCTKDGAQSLHQSLQCPIFKGVARGFADVITDADGVTRATRLETFDPGNAKVEPFAVALHEEFFGAKPAPGTLISGRSRINYAGSSKAFRTV